MKHESCLTQVKGQNCKKQKAMQVNELHCPLHFAILPFYLPCRPIL